MMRSNYLPALIFASFLFSCAQQTSPTGGPKDEDPPVLIQSIPKSSEVNFKGKVLTLLFNEHVIVNSPGEQLIITPDIGPDYEIIAKKNKVTLTLKNPLQDSTTYAFNFGESIQDITEKNPAENLHVAFSTGPTIDSLSISGYIYDLLTGKPAEKMVVAIYQHADTFNIFKHKPSYITRTLKDGTYRIGNLKQGEYFIYAYHDKNRNLIVDSKSEKYGFLINPILLEKDTSNIEIPVSPMDATPLKITRARPFSNYFTINLSKNVIDYSLLETKSGDTITSTFGENQANIITYNTTANTDSLQVNLNAYDSIGNSMDTTFYIKYSQREVTPDKFTIANQKANLYLDKGEILATFKFNKPIKSTNLDSLYVHIDSTTQIKFGTQDLHFNQKKLILTATKTFDKKILEKPPQENATNTREDSINTTQQNETPLTLEERANIALAERQKPKEITNVILQGKGAFISVDNDSSARSSHQLKPIKTQDLAVILVEVSTEENFIVNLLDNNFNIIRSAANSADFRFEDLLPGQYQVQLIIDLNKNGKWDSGNISEKREPEPIMFYIYEQETPLVPVKANWEVGPLLISY